MMDRHKCRLLPHKKKDVYSIQEVKQNAGWNITAFELPKVWEKTQGEGVVIGVIDSGCDINHQDLVANVLPGVNLIERGQEPFDKQGHGTALAGILVAENNNLGVVGVAPKAKIRPIKALNNKGQGDSRIVAEGIRWAVDNGVDMISMSIGAPFPAQQMRKAIQLACNKNIPVFVAAGNMGFTKEIFYPANYPETIAIGAVDMEMRRAKFSNTGINLDFMAPGVDILTTAPNNWYSIYSGTSMAQPFACGIAALLLSYSKSSRGSNLQLDTIDKLRDELKKYTTPVANGNYTHSQFYEGFGIIDPRKFLLASGG